MQYLRQSTASQEISLGQFLDSTDGDTEEGGLTIANTDIKIRKHGGTTLINKNSGGATVISNGVYQCTLDATDSDTAGMLEIYVHVAGALAVKSVYTVLTATAFDALLTGTFNNLGGTAQTGDSYAIVNDSVFGNSALNDSLSQIANVGAAINVSTIAAPNGFTLTTGSEVNDEDATVPLDGTRHELTDAAGTLDAIYKFDIGGDAAPVSVTFTGVYNSNNDSFIISANTGTDASPVWIQLGTLVGTNSSSDVVHTFTMFSNMVVSDITGQVQVRINNTGLTSSSFDTDQVFVSKSSTSRSVGYAGGSIWVNTGASNTNTEPFVDGVADNPVSTWAAALTLSASLGITDFHIVNGSTIALTGASDNFSLFGDNWTLQLGNQSISGAHFQGAVVSGIGTGAVRPEFDGCEMGLCTLVPFVAKNSGLNSIITFSAAGDYELAMCHSSIAGALTPEIDTGATVANVNLTMPGYEQGIEISNLNALGTDLFSISGKGQIIYAASSSGTVNQRGDWKVTNTGGVTITADDNTTKVDAIPTTAMRGTDGVDTATMRGTDGVDTATMRGTDSANTVVPPSVAQFNARTLMASAYFDFTADSVTVGTNSDKTGYSLSSTGLDAIASTSIGMVEIAKAIWDRVLTGATHNIINSAGKRVRDVIDSVVIFTDTAQAGSTNTITLSTGASSVDGTYDPSDVTIVSGTGAGQSRLILQYMGATKVATVDRNWKVTPDATSVFTITTNAGREHVNEGNAQAGTSTTITLNTLASSIDDVYVGQIVFIRSGTGDDQAGIVIDYDGTTKIATLDKAWGVTPDSTSGYVMIPASPVILANTTHIGAVIPTVSTITNRVTANTDQIDGNTTAATNLQKSALAITPGAAITGTLSTTEMTTDLTEATDDHYNGLIIKWTSGVLNGQGTDITDYDGTAKKLTYTATTEAPSNGDTFVIL